eukprot:m.106630 g.106630  ORF g.106630 m.106630 type:complete len:1922 (-) comp13308_c2_seq1:120-5885(-)
MAQMVEYHMRMVRALQKSVEHMPQLPTALVQRVLNLCVPEHIVSGQAVWECTDSQLQCTLALISTLGRTDPQSEKQVLDYLSDFCGALGSSPSTATRPGLDQYGSDLILALGSVYESQPGLRTEVEAFVVTLLQNALQTLSQDKPSPSTFDLVSAMAPALWPGIKPAVVHALKLSVTSTVLQTPANALFLRMLVSALTDTAGAIEYVASPSKTSSSVASLILCSGPDATPTRIPPLHAPCVAAWHSLSQQLFVDSKDTSRASSPSHDTDSDVIDDVTTSVELLALMSQLVALTCTTNDEAKHAQENIQAVLAQEHTEVFLPLYCGSLTALASLGVRFQHLHPVMLQTIQHALVRNDSPIFTNASRAACEALQNAACDAIATLLKAPVMITSSDALKAFASQLVMPSASPTMNDGVAQAMRNSICALEAVVRVVAAEAENDTAAAVCDIAISTTFQSIGYPESSMDVELVASIARIGAVSAPEQSRGTTTTANISAVTASSRAPTITKSARVTPTVSKAATDVTTSPQGQGLSHVFNKAFELLCQLEATVTLASQDTPASAQLRHSSAVQEALVYLASTAPLGHLSTSHLRQAITLFNRVAIAGLQSQAEDMLTSLLMLIRLVSVFCTRLFEADSLISPGQVLVEPFKAFWIHCTALNIEDTNNLSLQQNLTTIALYSPPLLDQSTALTARITSSFGYLSEHIDASKDAKLREKLATQINDHSHVLDVPRLDLASLLHNLALINLETRRLSHAKATFFNAFCYIEAVEVGQSSSMAVVEAVTKSLFSKHLDQLSVIRDGRDKGTVLEGLAQFLIAKWNHRLTHVKAIADALLSTLTQRFPMVLSSERVISRSLDLLSAICSAVHESGDVIGTNIDVALSYAPFKVTLPSTQQARNVIIADYTQHLQNILAQPLARAPEHTMSTLQTYISTADDSVHPEAKKSIEVIVKALQASKNSNSFSDLLGASFARRAKYQAQLDGVLAANDDEQESIPPSFEVSPCMSHWAERTITRAKKLFKSLKSAGNDQSKLVDPFGSGAKISQSKAWQHLEDGLYKITAMIVHQSAAWDPLSHQTQPFIGRLINLVVWLPIKLMSDESLTAATSCWSWIIAASPVLETRLLSSICLAWRWMVSKQVGLFSRERGHNQASEQVFRNEPTNAFRHHNASPIIWISFLSSRLRVVAGRSASQLQLIYGLLKESLAQVHQMCMHPAQWHARFALYSLGFQLLHTKGVLSSTHQMILRHLLYSAVLEFFGHAPQWPHEANVVQLLEAMIGCYKALASDRDACKKLDYQIRVAQMGGDRPKQREGVSSNTRRCDLALLLLRHEIDRQLTWHAPDREAPVSVPVPSEEMFRQLKSPSLNPNNAIWSEYLKIAWAQSPDIVVFMGYRFPAIDYIQRDISSRIKAYPGELTHLPEAVRYLVTPQNVENNCHELNTLLVWAPVAPITALNLLRDFHSHAIIGQYAIKALKSYPSDIILAYIPQLVQALRYDSLGFIRQYMQSAASSSQLLAHQLIWNMATNVYTDDTATSRDEVLADTLEACIEDIKAGFTPQDAEFYKREFDFFNDITDVSGRIRDKPLGPARKRACLEELAKVQLRPGCYLPSSPTGMVVEIDYKSGKPMQSAAKAPYLATFKVAQCTIDEIERIGCAATAAGEKDAVRPSVWQSCIFKVGDDVRQDMLAIQIMQLMKNVIGELSVDASLVPYRVVATAPGCGVIECVPHAQSRDELGRQTDASLYEYFLRIYGTEDSTAFQTARLAFIKTLAAYSVLCFLLQIKDRHNGNIMVDRDGRIIHIDFGFMFESSPGGNIGFEPDFKLTKEMVMIMGGDQSAEPFRWFRDTCVRCYLAFRPYHEQVVSLVALMLETKLPCFRTDKILDSLRARFQPGATEAEAAAYMKGVIKTNFQHLRTELYDMLQYRQNRISY